MFIWLLPVVPGPTDCFLTGTCGLVKNQVGPQSGMMYLALGLVGFGVVGLWREWRRPKTPPGQSPFPS